MKSLAPALLLLAAAAASPAGAQTAGPADVRVNQLVVYGEDACPQSTNDEIIVCVRRSENDRFRIPEMLRNDDDPETIPWANRAQEMEYMGRTGIGSCSAVGPAGHTGCLLQFIDQARAERQNSDQVDWEALIAQARQERLDRIDAESEAIEEELRARGE